MVLRSYGGWRTSATTLVGASVLIWACGGGAMYADRQKERAAELGRASDRLRVEGNLADAEAKAREAVGVLEQTGVRTTLRGEALQRLGEVLQMQQQTEQAAARYREALEFTVDARRKAGLHAAVAETAHSVADGELAVREAEQLGDSDLRAEGLLALARVHHGRGALKTAREMGIRAVQIRKAATLADGAIAGAFIDLGECELFLYDVTGAPEAKVRARAAYAEAARREPGNRLVREMVRGLE